jgi:hypothetical protein
VGVAVNEVNFWGGGEIEKKKPELFEATNPNIDNSFFDAT